MKLSFRASKRLSVMNVLLLVAGSLLIATPSLGQTATPSIAFLNPSGFADTGERGILVSDLKPDAGPGCCDAARQGYHLSAWVANAPPGARVFFSVVQRTLDFEITNTNQADEHSWEANWDIPESLLDGPATLYAYLVLNEEPIAVDEQAVTILRTENTTQITHPAPGGSFGLYTPLADAVVEGEPAARKATRGVIDALYYASDDLSGLLGFYSVSAPGTKPVWKACADEGTGASSFTTNRTDDGLRCTVDEADAGKVTAVAAVANDNPLSDPTGNQSGDAISVTSNYVQEPTSMSFVSSGSQRVGTLGDTGRFFCSTAESVRVTDQFGRAIPGANIDVHATGPSDQLKFHQPMPVPGAVSAVNQAPNRGSHAIENAFDCTGQTANSLPGNGNPNKQGEHQRFGFPDRKHVESLAMGTNDAGIWSFRMYSPEAGQTDYTVWLDEADDGCLANDDTFTTGELSVTGSIGWAQDPSFPIAQPIETLVPCVPAEPSPGPSESPGEEIDGSRDISLRIATSPIEIGESATFAGRIDAVESQCAADQRVVLKTRRPGGKFWTKMATRTDGQGRFEMVARARAPRDYRAVAPAADGCDRARSVIVRLRA